jgi:hypothetical protein
MVKLRTMPEFRAFLEIQAARAEELNNVLIMKDDIAVDLVRGELRAYARIQDDITNAPNIVAKFERGFIEEHANGAP